jgi:hypothetical protein
VFGADLPSSTGMAGFGNMPTDENNSFGSVNSGEIAEIESLVQTF